jgi:hypothetical protein
MYESVHLALPRWQFVFLCKTSLASRLFLNEMQDALSDRMTPVLNESKVSAGTSSRWSTFTYPVKTYECPAYNHISSHLLVVYRSARATPLGTALVAVTPEPFSRPHEGSSPS